MTGGTTGGAGGATTASTTGTGAGTTTGTSTTSSSTTGSSGALGTDPPQVINSGGMVLTTPKIQLIAYAEDPVANDAQAFLEEFAAKGSWAAQTAEYGVGPLTVLPAIMIAGTPPTKLDDNSGSTTPFEQTLIDNTTGTNPAWGAADANTIYMFQLPKGTDINSGGSCCSAFLGYHNETTAGSTNIAYGVSCNCGALQFPPLTEVEDITTNLSHEAAEAATDPFFFTALGWSGTDPDHLAWTTLTGGEVADMCEFNIDANYAPPGSTYMVQRSWSNKAAKAGTNPCVPVPNNEVYFNAVPVLTDTVNEADQFGNMSPTKGVKIPVGQTKTIDVNLETDGALSGPVTVTAYDGNYYLNGGQGSSFLDLSFTGSPRLGDGHRHRHRGRDAPPDDQGGLGRHAGRRGHLHPAVRSRQRRHHPGEPLRRRRRQLTRWPPPSPLVNTP